jgi:hypothetical protein
MALIERLAARKAAFYFVERDDAAYAGSHELVALIARWLTPGDPFAEIPDVLPLWFGSYLPFEAAMRRWAFPDVFVVVVGCPDANRRRELVRHIRERPPLGMFDVDADADGHDLPLVLHGFALPQADIRLSARGRFVERDTGLDIIGFRNDDELTAFEFAAEGVPGERFEDHLGDELLRMLVRGAGRRLPGVRAADGFEALVDQAFELYGIGAVGAAGSVAGVAFEQLIRAAVMATDAAWLEQRELTGHAKLTDLIGKLASAGGWDDGRLRRYQRLRNDLAHRLGDAPATPRNDDDLDLTRFGGQVCAWLCGVLGGHG